MMKFDGTFAAAAIGLTRFVGNSPDGWLFSSAGCIMVGILMCLWGRVGQRRVLPLSVDRLLDFSNSDSRRTTSHVRGALAASMHATVEAMEEAELWKDVQFIRATFFSVFGVSCILFWLLGTAV